MVGNHSIQSTMDEGERKHSKRSTHNTTWWPWINQDSSSRSLGRRRSQSTRIWHQEEKTTTTRQQHLGDVGGNKETRRREIWLSHSRQYHTLPLHTHAHAHHKEGAFPTLFCIIVLCIFVFSCTVIRPSFTCHHLLHRHTFLAFVLSVYQKKASGRRTQQIMPVFLVSHPPMQHVVLFSSFPSPPSPFSPLLKLRKHKEERNKRERAVGFHVSLLNVGVLSVRWTHCSLLMALILPLLRHEHNTPKQNKTEQRKETTHIKDCVQGDLHPIPRPVRNDLIALVLAEAVGRTTRGAKRAVQGLGDRSNVASMNSAYRRRI